MKKFTLVVTISTFSLALFAQDGVKKWKHAPPVYIMMRHGKMIEVTNGHRKPVTNDITLANQTTIHASGAIDASSGQTIQLKEGEFITMTGKIHNLNILPRPIHRKNPAANPATTPAVAK